MKRILYYIKISLLFGLIYSLSIFKTNGQTWDTLPGTLPNLNVHDFIQYHDTLILTGNFGEIMPLTNSNVVVGWDSVNLYSFPGIDDGSTGKSLYIYHNELYLGGNFGSQTDPDDIEKLAVWKDTVWERVHEANFDHLSNITHFMEYKDSLYIGGKFWFDDGPLYFNLMKYNGETFHTCEPYTSYCWALGVYDDILYSGIYGSFTLESNEQVHKFTKYNGEYWDHVYDSEGNIFPLPVSNLLLDTINHDFYVAGTRVYRYDGETFHLLGILGAGEVYKQAMCMYRGDLFIGGNFTSAGGVPTEYIARWDGENWSEPAGGIQNAVCALYEYKDELYVGGYFDTVGGYLPANGVARYYEPPLSDCHWLRPRVQTAVHQDTFYIHTGQPEVTVAFVNNNAYAESWQWSFDGGTAFSAGDTVNNTYDSAGTYTASVEVTQDGCTKTAEKQIVVEDITGISKPLDKKDISLYPNPVMSVVHLNLPAQDKQLPVSVYTQQGRELLTDSISAGSTRYALDVHHLPPGTYILKVNGISRSFTVIR
jgi:hypothetical protein